MDYFDDKSKTKLCPYQYSRCIVEVFHYRPPISGIHTPSLMCYQPQGIFEFIIQRHCKKTNSVHHGK